MSSGCINTATEPNIRAPRPISKSAMITSNATGSPARATATPSKTLFHTSEELTATDADTRKIAATVAPANKKRKRHDQDNATEETARNASKPIIKNDSSNKSTSVSSSVTNIASGDASTTKCKTLARTTAAKHIKIASNSGGSTSEAPCKRTKGFKSRRGPSFQGAEAANALMLSEVPMEFSTTCYYVQLGDDGQIFFIHEYHLSKSPRLFEEVKTAKSKLRKTQQQIIQLLPHDAGAFGQLVGYLYSDQFKALECNRQKKMIGHRMKEIHEVMSLAKYYDMPGLQRDIMRVVLKERIVQKVNAAAFFDWAEDMWYEEMDSKNGPFARYFQRHAPSMLQSATDKDLKSMMKFVGGGGGYLKELFWAMHKAISLGVVQTIKSETELIKMP